MYLLPATYGNKQLRVYLRQLFCPESSKKGTAEELLALLVAAVADPSSAFRRGLERSLPLHVCRLLASDVPVASTEPSAP